MTSSLRIRLKQARDPLFRTTKDESAALLCRREPLVHTPEMGRLDFKIQIIDQARHQGNCSVGPIGPQRPTGLSGVRLLPGADVLESFGEVKLLESVVQNDFESRPGELEHLSGVKAAASRISFRIQGRVIHQSGAMS